MLKINSSHYIGGDEDNGNRSRGITEESDFFSSSSPSNFHDFTDTQTLGDYYQKNENVSAAPDPMRFLEKDFAEYQNNGGKFRDNNNDDDDDDDDRRSVSSSKTAKSASSYASSRVSSSSSSSKHKKANVDDKTESWSSVFDYRLLLGLGVSLAILAFLFLYWKSSATDIDESDETNMTMQYAIDKTHDLQREMFKTSVRSVDRQSIGQN